MAFAPGIRLGVYEIESVLRAGGMGQVYRARDTRLDRTVAIKVVRRDAPLSADLQRRFEREARLISSLNHPHVCVLHDVGNQDGVDYLVMEFLTGESLADRLHRESPLPLPRLLEIGADIADALDAAHRQGIVHRDVKPGNVMLSDAGTKLLDFGLAKAGAGEASSPADPDAPTARVAAERMLETDAGTVLGTYLYMSPEQARGLSVDHRTDVWSLGVVLYQMACGRLPFDGATRSDVVSAILLKPPPEMATAGLPERFLEIVDKCLAKEREQRYQTARDLLLDLKQLARRLEIHSEVQRLSSDQRVASARSQPPGSIPGLASGTPVGAISQPPSAAPIAPFSWRRLGLPGPGALLLLAGLAATLAAAAAGHALLAGLLLLGTLAVTGYTLFAGSDSVAVLPFAYTQSDSVPLSDADKDYLTDGLTESIINTVSQFSNIKVISRSSVFRFKGQPVAPDEVARQLGVRNVLTGRVLQRSARLIISVQLEDTFRRRHIWGETYERETRDLVRLPRDIAADVSANLRARWSRRAVSGKDFPASAQAYEAYLKGLYQWNQRSRESVQAAVGCFETAIREDPRYALAYVGLADCYIVLAAIGTELAPKEAYVRARDAASRALELDPASGEAHAAMACIKAGVDWDLRGALAGFARAIKFKPGYATAHQWYAEHLVCARRDEEALLETDRTRELDPVSVIGMASRGMVLAQCRRYDDALRELRRAQEVDPSVHIVRRLLRDVYLEKQLLEPALAEHKQALLLAGVSAAHAEATAAALRAAHAEAGWHGYWRSRLELSQAPAERRLPYDLADESPYHRACLHARLGERERAVERLQAALEERDYGVFYLRTNPAFDSLQGEPAVQAIMSRIGLVS